MNRHQIITALLVSLSLAAWLCPVTGVAAQKKKKAMSLCVVSSTGALTVRSGKCKKTETKIENQSQLDGSLRIYGDGSKGGLEVTNGAALNEANNQYTDITIAQGASLSVSSGVILRCRGSFTNNGTIEVYQYTIGGMTYMENSANVLMTELRTAHPGISRAAAGNGAIANHNVAVVGGLAGVGIFAGEAKNILRPGPFGGGAGGGNWQNGGSGGGALTVLCAGAVVNNGLITADGSDGFQGSGGGAGGIVILASRTSVQNSAGAVISVRGGSGGSNSLSRIGAGGGGGGGIVHLLSPSITNAGTVTLSGGSKGAVDSNSITQDYASGGGAGGSCAGAGGNGSGIPAGVRPVTPGAAEDGGVGLLFTTEADPGSLF